MLGSRSSWAVPPRPPSWGAREVAPAMRASGRLTRAGHIRGAPDGPPSRLVTAVIGEGGVPPVASDRGLGGNGAAHLGSPAPGATIVTHRSPRKCPHAGLTDSQGGQEGRRREPPTPHGGPEQPGATDGDVAGRDPARLPAADGSGDRDGHPVDRAVRGGEAGRLRPAHPYHRP